MSNEAPSQMPRHVAIIMDGNGRWARKQGFTTVRGHREGAEAARRVVEVCADRGIRFLTLYAFSTENWSRPRQEVNALLELLRRFLREKLADFRKHKVRLNTIGDLSAFPENVQEAIRKAKEQTAEFREHTLTLALNYGARDEILRAVRTLSAAAGRGELKPEEISEADMTHALDTANLPDPDLIIRTSGELRLSNFLLWQASYAELWFTETLWPDFSKEEFEQALLQYSQRRRRFGARS